MPVWLKQGKLSGGLTTRKGNFRWHSSAVVTSGVFHALKLHYDLERFQVTLDGKKIADIPASVLWDDSWSLCIGSAPVKQRKPVPDMFIKQGNASVHTTPGFQLSGTLRKLRICNY